MTNKEPGYVYILTNPSIREDWVKIGKTTNMEKRLKTLNITALTEASLLSAAPICQRTCTMPAKPIKVLSISAIRAKRCGRLEKENKKI